MKVRWTGSSLRLRITPTELEAITRGERVGEALTVPGGVQWQVDVAPAAVTALTSEAGAMTLRLSAVDRERLAAPDAEGVYFQSPDALRYVIEKDFPCAHPRGSEAQEPVTETFQPPPDFERHRNAPEINRD